jgi:hypothetical protein
MIALMLASLPLCKPHEHWGRVVRPERFELPAFWFVARRSIQLSYGRTETCGFADPQEGRPLFFFQTATGIIKECFDFVHRAERFGADVCS